MERAGLRVAAVDIGTNTVRLLIRGDEGDVERRTEVVGLGEGVDAAGRLSEAAMSRAVVRLAEFQAAIAQHGVDRMRAVATSASRDAANRDDFFDRVEAVLGARPELISGEVEAGLSFAGAASLRREEPVLVLDPGGGSTEFVMGRSVVEFARSVNIGSVRLTERALPDRPPGADDLVRAIELIRGEMGAVALPELPGTVVGVAGTFTSLAAIHLRLDPYDRDRVHGTVLALEDLEALLDELAGLTVEQTAAIPSLDPRRAPVILAGAVIVLEAVRHTGCASAIVSESDLLDALADSVARGG